MGVTATPTVERFRLFQEPFEPAAVETESCELWEGAALVYLWVVCELSPLNEGKDDGVLQPRQYRPDAIQRQRVAGEHEVLRLETHLVGKVLLFM